MSRRIPKEIKEEISSKIQAGERVADLAEQYAISTKTIYGWLQQDSGEAVVSVLQYNGSVWHPTFDSQSPFDGLTRWLPVKSVVHEGRPSTSVASRCGILRDATS